MPCEAKQIINNTPRKAYIYLQGKRLTQRQAIKAHCYDCQGMGEDPTCENDECSLWPFSSYNRMCKRLGKKKGKMVVQKEIIPGSATFIEAPAVERALGKGMTE